MNVSKKIQEMEDLAIKKKSLDSKGVTYLKTLVEEHIELTGNNDIEILLPIIINYVFNTGFYEGVVSCIKILRKRD
jgi:hypothetical protein